MRGDNYSPCGKRLRGTKGGVHVSPPNERYGSLF